MTTCSVLGHSLVLVFTSIHKKVTVTHAGPSATAEASVVQDDSTGAMGAWGLGGTRQSAIFTSIANLGRLNSSTIGKAGRRLGGNSVIPVRSPPSFLGGPAIYRFY